MNPGGHVPQVLGISPFTSRSLSNACDLAQIEICSTLTIPKAGKRQEIKLIPTLSSRWRLKTAFILHGTRFIYIQCFKVVIDWISRPGLSCRTTESRTDSWAALLIIRSHEWVWTRARYKISSEFIPRFLAGTCHPVVRASSSALASLSANELASLYRTPTPAKPADSQKLPGHLPHPSALLLLNQKHDRVDFLSRDEKCSCGILSHYGLLLYCSKDHHYLLG